MKRLAILLSGFAIVVLAACSHDGRTLRPPGPDQTLSIVTTTTATPTTTGAAAEPGTGVESSSGTQPSGAALTVTAPWADGAAIDARYTCRGTDVSPAISWSGVPANATELALALIDLDADRFVHWVIAGIDPASTGIAAGKVPAGAIQATNGLGRAAFGGPCPPDGTHTYLLTLYALGQPSGLAGGVDGKTAVNTLEADQLASVSVSGKFG